MKKVKLLKNCVAGGKPRKIGDKVEVSDSDAFYMITTGAAEAATDAPAKKKVGK